MPAPPAFSGLVAERMRHGKSDAIRDILDAAAAPGMLSMAGGVPAPESFPVLELARALDEVLSVSAAAALQYAPTEGVPEMRAVIADRATATGAPATAERVLIISGSQQGLDLVSTAFVEQGDLIALDDPSYLGAVQTFTRAGARLLPVPSDGDGMDTSVLADVLADGARCKLVYVVPHFHNPTGAVLSPRRRAHLADLAERYGFIIVEDDPYADLAFDGTRLPSIDVHTDRTVRLMSLSKTLCPGLRVAGLIAPEELITELAAAKQCADLQTNTFGQHILARLLADPSFLPAHVRRLQRFYRDKAMQLSALLTDRLPWLGFEPPRGGLFFWTVITHPEVTSDALSRAARAAGVAIVPGTPFCVDRDGSRHARLSYATLSQPQMQEATRRLAAAFENATPGGTRPPSDKATGMTAQTVREADVMQSRTTTRMRLTGWSGDAGYFAFQEYDEFHPQAVVDVLHGKSAGAMFRGMAPPEACAELARRFWASPGRRERGSEAPGYYLGTYHYHRTTQEYLDETERVEAALSAVLDMPGDPLTTFYGGLADALASEGVTVRLAQHNGRKACRGLLRSWHGQGEYALAPHEDISQCSEPRQAGFEIQQVVGYHGVALNICLENGSAGRLAFWNIRPDLPSRRRLGLEYTGSPYPMGALDGIEMQWVEINAGDLYMFNGAHVHAVEPNTDHSQRRTTLAGILGFIDDKTVVSWT